MSIYQHIARDDILGPKPSVDFEQTCAAFKELNSMIGLRAVKDSISSMVELVRKNMQLEEEEQEPRRVALNRLFLGNPGTGKTTVARLYATILKDLGLLSKGEVVLKAASDFVGAVVGSSQTIANGILKNAEGCVLVIDEAYGLFPGKGTPDSFKEAVVNTIVEKVQNVPGEDRCVIMIGYEPQMKYSFFFSSGLFADTNLLKGR